MTPATEPTQTDLFDAEIIPLRLAIKAMRDSGYKNTAYALAELIDNAAQANATMIEVLCVERRELVRERERSRLHEIAVLDNGIGMDARTLRMALQFGNGTRLDDRSGIGRFGMGLPNASISQASRVDVWTWQNGPANAVWSFIDLDDIDLGELSEVPQPERRPVPEAWTNLSDHVGSTGTLIVWTKLDFERLTWKRAERTLQHTETIAGRIYRRFIESDRLAIRLLAQEQGVPHLLVDRQARVNDPLYLTPLASLPAPFDEQPMFERLWPEEHKVEFQGKTHTVRTRYSLAKADTVALAGTRNRGDTQYGKHAAGNMGVSVLRAGREIMLDGGWCIGYDPRERWWGAEVEFQPGLDEVFGVTNNKQAATHFSELARTEWKELREDPDEERLDVVRRLQEDGDPRGWLLQLSDAIHRNLDQLRKRVEAQAAGRRSSKRTRHGQVDPATKAANRVWQEKSKSKPVPGEKPTPTAQDLKVIHEDLTENKHYDPDTADALVSLIRDSALKVVFLEADFPDAYQLFNVEMKGSITEITFNREHPGFADIFGTVMTADTDVGELSRQEALGRLTRAVNATKIVFAGWARYEREAGVDRAKLLRRVRFDWGQMAAQFLEPEPEP